MTGQVDIILACKNAENTIEECISSILSQTFQAFNLFIFDDCSDDNTVEIIKSFNDKRITLIKSNKNIGTYAAKNFILKNFCKSEFVALHDADDISLPARIKKQVSALRGNKLISCLGTGVEEFWTDNKFKPHTMSDSQEVDSFRKNYYPEIITRSTLQAVYENITSDDKISLFFKQKFCMNGTVMFRRTVLESLGGWDGKTRIGADTEIFIRALLAGEVRNLKDVLYKRRFHESSLTASKETGIGSEIRKKYCQKLIPVVQKTLAGQKIKRDMFFPEFDFEVHNCAD
jgi:glycosyltransferase involved in cell wall biosynthesis